MSDQENKKEENKKDRLNESQEPRRRTTDVGPMKQA